MYFAVTVLFGLLLTSLNPAMAAKNTKTVKNVVTLQESIERKARLSNIHYDLFLELSKEEKPFLGSVTISFDYKRIPNDTLKELHLDFEGGEVLLMRINGKEIDFSHRDSKVYFSTASLDDGKQNVIEITYNHPYSTTGEGLHRSVDPKDGQVYVYSHGEPNFINQILPCFDQPDLKASFELQVAAPSDWEVISNVTETTVDEQAGEKLVRFPRAETYSTYLFAVHAGPYTKWEDNFRYPLRLFAPASMAKYIDAADWFAITKDSFDELEEAFGTPYPFKKYDQIVVYEFNSGAMENIAAVTFTDRLIPQRKMLPTERIRLAEVIVHEMVHMWFGNLVTMAWWNDLWLNEAFATMISYWAIDQFADHLHLDDPNLSMFARKTRAYEKDDLVTTHAVAPDKVGDTLEGRANFDMISYGKGSAALKQLMLLISEKAFFSGLKAYFAKHRWKNTVLTDFISAMKDAVRERGNDDAVVDRWAHDYLLTKGTNTVSVVFEEQNGVISRFEINQKPDRTDKILRTHAVQVGLYDLDENNQLVLREMEQVEINGQTTDVQSLIGQKAPALVFPNYGDHAFVHVELDPKSLQAVEEHLSTINNPLVKQMLWFTLSNMVSHGQLSAQKFARIAMNHLPKETDDAVLTSTLGRLTQSLRYAANTVYPGVRREIEDFLWKEFESASPGSTKQAILFPFATATMSTQDRLNLARVLVNKEAEIEGLELTPDRRWNLISGLAKNARTPGDQKAVEEMIQSEVAADSSDKAQNNSIYASVLLPDQTNKQVWLQRILGKDTSTKYTDFKLQYAMAGFYTREQQPIAQFAIEPFFEALPELARTKSDAFLLNITSTMVPDYADCRDLLNAKIEGYLKDNEALSTQATRNLIEFKQRLAEMIEARAISEKEGM
ncbi:MAG: aminopeptidase N [Bacteriovoracia bacterium]